MPDGTVRRIYKGPITVDEVLHDVEQLKLPAAETRSYGLPLAGRWHNLPAPNSPKPIAFAFMREGYLDEGVAYVTAYFDAYEARPNFAKLIQQPQVQVYLSDFAAMLADLNRLEGGSSQRRRGISVRCAIILTLAKGTVSWRAFWPLAAACMNRSLTLRLRENSCPKMRPSRPISAWLWR